MIASNLLIMISQTEWKTFCSSLPFSSHHCENHITPMSLRLPALPAPSQLMRVIMPRFWLSYLGRDPIACNATLSPSSKLNSSVMPRLSSTTCTLTLFCARFPIAPHLSQAWSSCLFAFGHPLNRAENGCYTSGYKWRRAALWLGSVLQSAAEGDWFWIRAD